MDKDSDQLLMRRETVSPAFLSNVTACSCVALSRLTPLTASTWSPRFSRPSVAAGPLGNTLLMTMGKSPRSLPNPPTIAKPKPCWPRCKVTSLTDSPSKPLQHVQQLIHTYMNDCKHLHVIIHTHPLTAFSTDNCTDDKQLLHENLKCWQLMCQSCTRRLSNLYSGPCNSFNCLGHFKHVSDDDDDDDDNDNGKVLTVATPL